MEALLARATAADPAASPARVHGASAPAPRAAPPAAGTGPCLGELLGALSHAFDLTGGQPAGHGLRSCWIAQQLGIAIGLGTTELRDLYYTTLLKDAGCSSNSARVCQLFLTDDRSFKSGRRGLGLGTPGLLGFLLRHTGAEAGLGARVGALVHAARRGEAIERELVETRCSRGADVARRLRLGEAVAAGIHGLDEHWDGSGHPRGLAGAAIPLASRIALLAQMVDVFHQRGGAQAARQMAARRRGGWFDPRLADAFAVLGRDPGFWSGLAAADLGQHVLAMEPARQPQPVDDDYLDDIAAAFGQIVDAKSPFTGGHSARVALFADRLAARLDLGDDTRRWLRRGALLHDVGKLGVSNRILDKRGKLDPAERAQMQRHAMHTEQILGRISAFDTLARVAGAHHERLDGSGYPRGLDARHIRLETRIITTADVFDALTADRPYRAALPLEQALDIMRADIGKGIAADCFEALRDVLGELPAA
jgi:HD-GYP domain-containing protein (c-di-GMP phosphodiesterase class II)